MTRVGILDLDLTYLIVGGAVLYGVGLLRSRRDTVRLAGLALLTGWAVLGILASVALVAGSALSVATLLGLAVAAAVGAAVTGRFVPAAPRREERWAPTRFRLVAGLAGAGVVVATLVEELRRALVVQPWAWDAWAFWVPKAEAIVYRGGIGTSPGSFSSFANPDYPPFAPVSDASVFRFAGKVDPGILGLQHWVLAAAFFAALAGLLWHRVAPEILLPSLAVLAVTPAFDEAVASLLAQDDVVISVGLAGAAGALWLLERDPRHAALFAVFASALGLTKNEGFALALLMAILLAVVCFRRQRWAAVAVVVAPVAAMLPWKLWVHLNHVPPGDYYSYGDLLSRGHTIDRLGRLGTTLDRLPAYYLGLDRSLVLLPVLAVLALLAWRSARWVAVFGAVAIVGSFVGNVLVYWISNASVQWYIETSAKRTSEGPIVLAAVLAPILAAELVREGVTRRAPLAAAAPA